MQKLSSKILVDKSGASYLPAYTDALTNVTIIASFANIRYAFPDLAPGFYDILGQRLKEHGFTDQRLTDAVSNVIDTCRFPRPTIADFISWDKRITLFTYEDMVRKTNEFGAGIWDTYQMVKIKGRKKPLWINKDDITQYNIDITTL